MRVPLHLASLLRHAAREHGRTPLSTLDVGGTVQRSSWAQMERRARQWGQVWERLGVAHGQPVALLGWNAQGLLEAVLGSAASGRQALTLNPRQFPEQLIWAVNQTRAQALVFDQALAPLVEAMQLQMGSVQHYIQLGGPDLLPELGALMVEAMDAESLLGIDDPDWRWPDLVETDTALISFTAASSGWPRGVPTSHRAAVLQAMAAALPDAYGLSSEDAVMPLLPVAHSGGWALCLCAAVVGSRLVLVPPGLGTAAMAEGMASLGVTLAAGPPTVWQELLDHMDASGLRMPALRRAVVGSAAFPPELLPRLRALPNLDVMHTWGMSEIAPPALVARGAGLVVGSDGRLPQGRPSFGVELALVDDAGNSLPRDGQAEGLLVARGPWTLDAYLGESDSPLIAVDGEEGWFPTGDIARIDERGWVTITDRRKDLIRCGGEWISAAQLERIALSHADVAEAAVIARTDPLLGERPLLIVVQHAGASLDADTLLGLFEGRVAEWQRPAGALVFPELPRLSTGEVDKRELRALVETVLD
ncbi:fatty-acyl-CoA synthase [Inhella inkyongensis]|uniref:Fatty-acyl-CoA synthase n=1 Tax=Inhella inkyongensis TaxID=392593 RepID=A0A840S1S1_9BURK|nr:AMP-binding protein [Inhella inkyongensis]MBB5203693.1 fatty-acyl-CoA synthase [Inhella inkyongensis]